MANRALLHTNKLEEFKRWLIINGHNLLTPKGTYEVLRWNNPPGEPMPIIFSRIGAQHLTCNDAATPYVVNFIKERKGD